MLTAAQKVVLKGAYREVVAATGETWVNVSGHVLTLRALRYKGLVRPDSNKLTAEGLKQAKELGAQVDIDPDIVTMLDAVGLTPIEV